MVVLHRNGCNVIKEKGNTDYSPVKIGFSDYD